MAFRRRPRRRFAGPLRGAGPDLFWRRGNFSGTLTVGAPLTGFLLMLPQDYVAGPRDDHFTVLRTELDLCIALLQVVDSVGSRRICFRAGLYVEDQDSALDDPRLISLVDQRTDWMDLWSLTFLQNPGAVGDVFPRSICACDASRESGYHRSVRTRRKLEQNEALTLSLAATGIDGTSAIGFDGHFSLLLRKSARG